ncbi:alpha/beta hydrolase fold domain-containing protein [Arthrobacter sp. B1I2]|uniref:alpha/beta hydrolase fold domain-containing protein n=1 Tax=Arthrobacter sp. B1I2 TaxID=3042263 RepID=UPI00278A46DB|nr:alpha/beta hydrolase [Arthrobacter sp. B1I2]MDQ0733288.1 monoterpene epsilon-lactone hydrolase [Arthrobacter sp. B1I2]
MKTLTSPRPSLHSRLMRSILLRTKNTSDIAATVAKYQAEEVDGRPDPTPTRSALSGLAVTRMMIADTVVFRLRPKRREPRRAVLYFHGGGYIEDTSVGTWTLGARMVKDADAEVWIPAYRLAPRQTAETTVAVGHAMYEKLISVWAPAAVTVSGDSAGGGLALATVQAAAASGLPMPAMLGMFAPWVDLTMSDWREETAEDPMLDLHRLRQSAKAYAGALALDDPRVSPLHGRLADLPFTWITVGDDDLLVHQNRRLRTRLAEEEVPHQYLEDPGMPHVHILFPIPEGRKALNAFLETLKARTGAR